jgi:hypothetical protein
MNEEEKIGEKCDSPFFKKVDENAQEPQTENLKIQTEQMEVHHHPNVEKKGFKEYFLEFLMIFLAVTLGFFAENMRENISASKKENIDINSLFRNLTTDSATITYQMQRNEDEINSLDSMMVLIRSGRYNYEPEMLYRLAYSTRGFQVYEYSNVTFEEMKSSGNFSLIRSHDIRNNLVNYNNFINNAIRNLELRILEAEKNQANLQSDILDDSFYPPVDNIIYHHALRSDFYKKENKSISFSPGKQVQFSKLYNLLFESNVVMHYYQMNMEKLKGLNEQLLATIKKEYHLKDE